MNFLGCGKRIRVYLIVSRASKWLFRMVCRVVKRRYNMVKESSHRWVKNEWVIRNYVVAAHVAGGGAV